MTSCSPGEGGGVGAVVGVKRGREDDASGGEEEEVGGNGRDEAGVGVMMMAGLREDGDDDDDGGGERYAVVGTGMSSGSGGGGNRVGEMDESDDIEAPRGATPSSAVVVGNAAACAPMNGGIGGGVSVATLFEMQRVNNGLKLELEAAHASIDMLRAQISDLEHNQYLARLPQYRQHQQQPPPPTHHISPPFHTPPRPCMPPSSAPSHPTHAAPPPQSQPQQPPLPSSSAAATAAGSGGGSGSAGSRQVVFHPPSTNLRRSNSGSNTNNNNAKSPPFHAAHLNEDAVPELHASHAAPPAPSASIPPRHHHHAQQQSQPHAPVMHGVNVYWAPPPPSSSQSPSYGAAPSPSIIPVGGGGGSGRDEQLSQLGSIPRRASHDALVSAAEAAPTASAANGDLQQQQHHHHSHFVGMRRDQSFPQHLNDLAVSSRAALANAAALTPTKPTATTAPGVMMVNDDVAITTGVGVQKIESFVNVNGAGNGGGGAGRGQSRYWTQGEHERFLEALARYGPKDVRAIACYVGSRNATQVRTHAQKYFLRLAREAGGSGSGGSAGNGNGTGTSTAAANGGEEAKRRVVLMVEKKGANDECGGDAHEAAKRRRCMSDSDLARMAREIARTRAAAATTNTNNNSTAPPVVAFRPASSPEKLAEMYANKSASDNHVAHPAPTQTPPPPPPPSSSGRLGSKQVSESAGAGASGERGATRGTGGSGAVRMQQQQTGGASQHGIGLLSLVAARNMERSE